MVVYVANRNIYNEIQKSVFVPENQYFCHKESVFLYSGVGSYDFEMRSLHHIDCNVRQTENSVDNDSVWKDVPLKKPEME